MLKRDIESEVRTLSKEFPIVALLGPRQSGKTTLSKKIFPKFKYVSLEDIDTRRLAERDPREFLELYSNKVIIDEIQRVPELISYLQTHVDSINKNGQYVITGSHNYLLMENISQSLAGRVGIAKLLPFCFSETKSKITLNKFLFNGGYPRIYDKKIRPTSFYNSYISTYIEKDIRLIKNITNVSNFTNFMKILAGRTGQIINTNSLANECGVAHNTIKDWISVLETSYIVFKLQPFHKNYNKRIVKSPKLYFVDTGLACFLLGLKNDKDLNLHFMRGELFETLVVSEMLKWNFNNGMLFNMYYWKDNKNKEIDLLLEFGNQTHPIEIKSSKTFQDSFLANLNYWLKLTGKADGKLVYSGDKEFKVNGVNILNWQSITNKKYFP